MIIKWFKHDSNAHRDTKIKRLKNKYGITGYGLYWYCLELIAEPISKDNITFELEDDAYLISIDWNLDRILVQEIMAYMIDLGLFENDDGHITCLKLAKRLDDTNARNPQTKQLLAKLGGQKVTAISRTNSEDSPTNSEDSPTNSEDSPTNSEDSPTRLDKTRLDQIRLDQKRVKKKPAAKKEFILNEKINPVAWSEFEQHREKIKKGAFTHLAKTKASNKLINFTFEQQQEIIDYSIIGGYSGLFTDKIKKTKQNERLTFDQIRQSSNNQAATDFAEEILQEEYLYD